MIFFHGTTEQYIKNIKKHGLMAVTTDQWLLEITNKNVCCLSKRPVSGEGGNPLFFARNKGQNGYLVVVKFPKNVLLEDKLIAIFDNKTLDDYVQKHFFVRQEFREIGYQLFNLLREYKNNHFDLEKLCFKRRPATPEDKIIFCPQDQREYYKELRTPEKRYMNCLPGIECSDEFGNFLQYLGLWENVWKFLLLHFKNVSPEAWASLQEKQKGTCSFWQNFYQRFKLDTEEPKQGNWLNWFSPAWLTERKSPDVLSQRNLADVNKNCQILVESIEPKYILGCIHITTPAGILPEFCFKIKSGIVQAIWKRVEKMQKNAGDDK